LVELSKGEDADDGMVAHCNVDARDAWEQNALLVQHIDMAQLKGDTSVDMLKRNAPTQIGGREMIVKPSRSPRLHRFPEVQEHLQHRDGTGRFL